MGTLGFGFPGVLAATEHTTDDAVTVQRHLAAMRELGAEVVSMEVSSHALDQHRVGGVRFNTAAFTNLTRDHLDYHGSMKAYGDAKARLFDWPSLAVESSTSMMLSARSLPRNSPRRGWSSPRSRASRAPAPGARAVRAVGVAARSRGLVIGVDSSWGPAQLNVPLIGEFNADNVLTVLAVLLAWDIPLAQSRRGAGVSAVQRPGGWRYLAAATRRRWPSWTTRIRRMRSRRRCVRHAGTAAGVCGWSSAAAAIVIPARGH